MLLMLRVVHASYLGDVLPALVVMGAGMVTLVAPLTATVLASVDAGRAGLASGINNAAARAAGLIAVAALPLLAGDGPGGVPLGGILQRRLPGVRCPCAPGCWSSAGAGLHDRAPPGPRLPVPPAPHARLRDGPATSFAPPPAPAPVKREAGPHVVAPAAARAPGTPYGTTPGGCRLERMTIHENLLGGPPPTHLPDDPEPRELLANGTAPADVAAKYPTSSLAWAQLADSATRARQCRRVVRLRPYGLPPAAWIPAPGRLEGPRPGALGARAEPRLPARPARPRPRRAGDRRAGGVQALQPVPEGLLADEAQTLG